MLVWIISAVVIVVVLAVYAIQLKIKLNKRDKQRAIWRQEVEQVVQQRTDSITNSIVVIAGAMLEQQMSLSECCIRLSALLNQLGPVAAEQRFQALHKAAEELSHIPILDGWKKLKFREQMRYIKEMEVIESKYSDFVLEICRALQQNGIGANAQVEEKNGVGFYQP